MDHALTKHEEYLPNVQKFRLKCYDYRYSKSTICKWIDSATASLVNLEELNIYLHPQYATKNYRVSLSRIVFSYKKLKDLRLAGGIIVDNIPTNVFFPCLKTLKLTSISIVSDNPLNKKLSVVCPVLETFHIEDCSLEILREGYTKKELCLKYLTGSLIQDDCTNNLACLDLASINVTKSNGYPTFKILKQLELCDTDMFQILELIGGCNKQPVFQHLTHLVVKVNQKHYFSALPALLEHSPNLTSLVLKKAKFYPYGYEGKYRWDAPLTVSKCLLCNLETIQINEFNGFQEVKVVKYFLKNALVLKKLVLCVARDVRTTIKTSILDEPRASGQCEVEFRSIIS
ncbi:hypothetical protein REPUB_Repub05bG0036500 [Reevesia pubescens]